MKIDDPVMAACVDVTKHDDGTYEIACKHGHWSASDADWSKTLKRAKHYFNLYLRVGAYESHLKEAGL